jgi:hypothetical protein
MKKIICLPLLFVIILSSCSIEDNFPKIDLNQGFYKKIIEITSNPGRYSSLVPERINPHEVELLKSIESFKKAGARTYGEEESNKAIPEEIAKASEAFKSLTYLLIQKSNEVDYESFLKLAFAVELEVVNSNLSEIEKEFLFKELAFLKLRKSIEAKKFESSRILCDSEFECEVLSCVQARVESALDPSLTYVELAFNIFWMPENVAYWFAFCTLAYLEPA